MKLSVVIPVYNGAATLPKVVADCYVALAHLDFELVLVNDGSKDNSEELIFNLAKEHPNIKAISLTKNFGEFNAVMCGLNFAVGDYVAIIDDDGQNPPAEILKLLAEAEKGFKVVYARYEEKKHSWWRNAGSWLNNLLATVFIGKPYGLYLSSFKVMRKALVAEVVKYRKKEVYIDALVLKQTQNIGSVEASHKSAEGPSRYSNKKLIRVFAAMLITHYGKWGYWFFYLLLFMFLWGVIIIISSLLQSGINIAILSGMGAVGLGISLLAYLPDSADKRQFEIAKTSF
jgi:glycosyltransferase involved in cell wall biosynthesis